MSLRLHEQPSAFAGYARMALLSCYRDRGLIFSDLILATLAPYLVQAIIWLSIYRGSDHHLIAGYSLTELLFYYAFAIAISRLNNGYDIIFDLSERVTSSSLDPALVKPTPYPLQRLYDWIGATTLYIIPLGIVLSIQIFTAGTAGAPLLSVGSGYTIACFVVLSNSVILAFLVAMSLAIACFWVVKSDMLLTLLLALQAFLGGTLLPPEFWPDWAEPILSYNPFRFMIAAPAELLARDRSDVLAWLLCGGLFYTLLFALLVIWLWQRAMRRYEGVGG
ncbi:ABC-2 family transporter protein [Halomonas sp. DP5Y7-2]|uniref:ABC-2 family transporter protein n=1 Tax=Halomonas sp. DP5Y7-2 TaxID=2859076 RepID=UPI001C996570|nr:ABC-2 family transporter protein [Halomonas sp. DP5Y7-2]MBY5983222.1 ABC-2 family transporter protein [Halomonas sp. DP5Y7-2]